MTIAVLRRLREGGVIGERERTVAYVTGNGLKTVDALEASMGPALEVRPTIESFEAAAERANSTRGAVMIRLKIPTVLRSATDAASVVEVEGPLFVKRSPRRSSSTPTLKRACSTSTVSFGASSTCSWTMKTSGSRRGLDTPVAAGQTVSLHPAVAGG